MSEPAKRRCTARTKSGKKCKQWAMANGYCNAHGGMNKPGVDHPRTVHGLRSDPKKNAPVPGARKASGLPSRFYDSVMEAVDDPNLASLNDEIIIVDVRISDLSRRLDTGESGALWMSLQDAVENYQSESDQEEAFRLLNRIFQMIERGSTDHQQWLDINMNIEQKARLIRAETQRMKDVGMLMRTDRVLLFIRAVVEVVMRNVPDPDQQERIRRSIERLLDLPDVNLDGGL